MLTSEKTASTAMVFGTVTGSAASTASNTSNPSSRKFDAVKYTPEVEPSAEVHVGAAF
jgi:hypothetical protein